MICFVLYVKSTLPFSDLLRNDGTLNIAILGWMSNISALEGYQYLFYSCFTLYKQHVLSAIRLNNCRTPNIACYVERWTLRLSLDTIAIHTLHSSYFFVVYLFYSWHCQCSGLLYISNSWLVFDLFHYSWCCIRETLRKNNVALMP